MSSDKALREQESNLDSFTYENDSALGGDLPRWIKVSAIAAASALVGGLAAAWFYRHTLSRLQQADQDPHDSKFGIREEGIDGE